MDNKQTMSRQDAALALLVVIVWGTNFTVVKLGLSEMPSMVLAALRYTLTAFPFIFFVKRPAVSWYYCVAYGITVGVGQFGSMFYSLSIGMPAGIASVTLQFQFVLTIIMAAILFKESVSRTQIVGFVLATVGLFLIGGFVNVGVSSIPIFPFMLTIFAAACWSLSNIIVRHVATVAAANNTKLDMTGLVVWSSLAPVIPLLLLALTLDTPQTIIHSLTNVNLFSFSAIIYISFFASLFGFATWSHLLSRYPAVLVAPLSLLAPVFGLLTSRVVLNEKLSVIQWAGGLFILVGLFVTNVKKAPRAQATEIISKS